MHGALHCWSRLKWLADINALLTTAPEGGVERLVGAAEARGTARAAAQALLLCRRLLATPLPDRLMATLAKSATVRWLEATALNAMTTGLGEREPREERFGTTRGSLSTFLLGRSWRYRLSELGIHLINQTDVLAVPLPERLRFLYPYHAAAILALASRQTKRFMMPQKAYLDDGTSGNRTIAGRNKQNGPVFNHVSRGSLMRSKRNFAGSSTPAPASPYCAPILSTT